MYITFLGSIGSPNGYSSVTAPLFHSSGSVGFLGFLPVALNSGVDVGRGPGAEKGLVMEESRQVGVVTDCKLNMSWNKPHMASRY